MRELFIERRDRVLRIAIRENGVLSECFMEEDKDEPLLSEIYKGTVKNIIPGIKSAFIDIGYKRQAFMPLNYLNNKHKNLKKGDDVIVEILKEQYKDKGCVVTDKYTLPGRYVVLERGDTKISFSKKINDEEFKCDLEKNVPKIEGIKITVRTNAKNAALKEVIDEIESLHNKFLEIEREGKYSLKPKRLYGENTIIHKVLRDFINNKKEKIILDNIDDYFLVKDNVLNHNIEVLSFEGVRNMFDYYGLEKEILSLRNNKVNLMCGGNIVIQKTEAMHVIDVNSNKNINGKNSDKNAEETNIEAAREIGRQIRVRNLQGIILIDFIDMKEETSKKKVLDELNKSLFNDKRKSTIYPFTELGLVQIARRRRGKSIYDFLEEDCKYCKGNGLRIKLSYLVLLIKNEILKVLSEGASINDIYIEINKDYENDIREDIFKFLNSIGGLDKNIYLNFVETIEYYKVESLIFKNQIESVKEYKVYAIQKQ